MPATTRARSTSKRRMADTPYKRPAKQADKQAINDTAAIYEAADEQPTLLGKAAQGLVSLVSWVLNRAEDLPDAVRKGANGLHREPQSKSTLSRLEEGTLHNEANEPQELGHKGAPRLPPGRASQQQASGPKRQISLLSSDLAPHYLGKTPQGVKGRKGSGQAADVERNPPRYQVSRFDSGSFKIPHLPTPPQDRKTVNQPQNPEPIPAFDHLALVPTNDSRDSKSDMRSASWMSIDSQGKRYSKLDPQRWQTTSSTGILAAWREIVERQQAASQQAAFALPTHPGPSNRGRSQSRASSAHADDADQALWHSNISFSQRTEVDAPTSSRVHSEAEEAAASRVENRYWGPVRHFPHAEPLNNAPRDSSIDLRSLVQTGRKSHARRASRSRTGRSRTSLSAQDVNAQKSPSPQPPQRQRTPSQSRASRQPTPRSAVSSTRGRLAGRSREQSQARPPNSSSQVEKPAMIDSQVQTSEAEMMALDPVLRIPTPPTLSKERRKRPGCFSALDEDMEDKFGPYSDVPVKRTKLTQEETEDQLLERPKVPLLREDDAVLQLRSQQKRELEKVERAEAQSKINVTSKVSAEAAPVNLPFTFDKPTEPVLPSQAKSKDNENEQSKESSTLHKPAPSSTIPSFAFSMPSKPSEPVKSFANLDLKSSGSSEKTSLPTSSTPSFKFGAPSKQDKIESSAKITELDKSAPSGTNQPTFTFGKPAEPAKEVSAPAVSKPAFDFDKTALAQTATSSDATPKFNFGIKAPETVPVTQENALSGLDFSSFANKKQDEQESKQKATPAFNFGAPAAKPSQADKQEPSKPTFSFGSSTQVPTNSIFGTSNKESEAAADIPASTGFDFGMQNSSTTDEPASTAFEFGAQPPPDKPVFQFGAPAKPVTSATDVPAKTGAFDIASLTQKSGTAEEKSSAPATTSTFSFGNTDTSQPASKPAANGFSFGTSNNNNATPAFGSVGGTTATPAFGSAGNAFGAAPLASDKKVGDKAAAFSSTAPASLAGGSRGSTPGFTFGASEPAAAAGTQAANTTNAFGQTTFGHPNTSNRDTVPTQAASIGKSTANTFSGFGTQSSAPAFGNAPSAGAQDSAKAAFGGFGNTTNSAPASSGFVFGAAAQQPQQHPPHALTAPSSSQSNAAFNFGSTAAAPTSSQSNTAFAFGGGNTAGTSAAPPATFSFGAAAPASSGTTPAFAFGQQTQQPQTQPQAPAMAFGGSAQGFNFGGTATAPASGFPSAAPSPVITAPGSPNPFAFNMGAAGDAAGGTGPGGRKIAQPRSRRKK